MVSNESAHHMIYGYIFCLICAVSGVFMKSALCHFGGVSEIYMGTVCSNE